MWIHPARVVQVVPNPVDEFDAPQTLDKLFNEAVEVPWRVDARQLQHLRVDPLQFCDEMQTALTVLRLQGFATSFLLAPSMIPGRPF